jgi:hypothetical protein
VVVNAEQRRVEAVEGRENEAGRVPVELVAEESDVVAARSSSRKSVSNRKTIQRWSKRRSRAGLLVRGPRMSREVDDFIVHPCRTSRVSCPYLVSRVVEVESKSVKFVTSLNPRLALDVHPDGILLSPRNHTSISTPNLPIRHLS